jgi:hypothetical protein
MARSTVIVLGLVFQACSGSGSQRTHNPPPPDPLPEPIPEVVPQPVPALPVPSSGMPTWDEVPSPHPEGATNPPSPVLIVTPERRCYKRWVSPFLPAEKHQDRVEACGDSCGGTEIQCPPEADELLAARPDHIRAKNP